MSPSRPQRILVIKLSALGDFILSIGSFQAIRRHHPDAQITLLTTKPFAGLGEASGCFDQVWTDTRPRWPDVAGWWSLGRRLRHAGFDRVYDLQRSQRSAWYFRLAGRPEWVGTAAGCSHQYVDPPPPLPHITEREAAQLALAGIDDVGLPDLSFLQADLDRFALPTPYALLVPGSAPHRPAKRWPAAGFAGLGRELVRRGLIPVLIGTEAERDALAEVAAGCPEAHDLSGRTGLADLAALGRRAALAIGNDTGPMHLLAAAGCPSLVLFSADSDPVQVAPRGRSVALLRQDSLQDLSLDRVVAAIETLGAPAMPDARAAAKP